MNARRFEDHRRIEIVREAVGGLERRVWRFHLRDEYRGWTCALLYYGVETRASRRHKWRVEERWAGFANRGNSIKTQPILPDEIEREARERAAEKFAMLRFQ